VNEIAVDCVAGRNFKLRKWVGHFFQAQAAALGNIERAREHLRRVLEHAVHLFVALDEKLRTLELHASCVADGLAGLDADHHILGVGIVLAEIVAVVGGHQRQPEILLKLEQAGMDAMLHLQALVLNFEEEPIFAENVGEGSGRGAGGVVVVLHQPLGDFAFQASGQADQALRMLRQKFLAHPGLVIKAVQRGFRGDLHQVAVAFFIFG